MQEEIWKDVVGYEGLYQVSNFGKVRSSDRVVYRSSTPQFCKGQIIAQGLLNTGYKIVTLWNKKKRKVYLVHRLVAQAFIPNEENKDYIDHINGIRTDNHVANLRWCTRNENVNFPLARSRYISANQKRIDHIRQFHHTHSLKIVQLTKDGVIIKGWNSVKEASMNLSISENNIYASCIGKRITAGGYKWKYIKDLI